MKETLFYFQGEEAEGKRDNHALPDYGESFHCATPSLRADSIFTYGRDAEEEMHRLAARILNELAPPTERLLAKTRAVSLSHLLSLITDYCAACPRITLPKPPYPDAMLSLCSPDLFFSLGTVMHHALAGTATIELSLTLDADRAHFMLTAPVPSADMREAAEGLGLTPDRLSLLQSVADASEISLSLVAGAASSLILSVPTCVPQYLHLQAGGEDMLLAAFMLPLSYFSY